jgi:hypothetical protein
MRKKLRLKIIERYDSQVVGARALNFDESRLSKIIRGHVDPNPTEKARLIAEFGRAALKPSSALAESRVRRG